MNREEIEIEMEMDTKLLAVTLVLGSWVVVAVLAFALANAHNERGVMRAALEQTENLLATSRAQTQRAIANTDRGIALVKELMQACDPDRTEQEQSGKI